MAELGLIVPDWPAPAVVGALSTTRDGGVSVGAYRSLNLGDHVGDDPQAVAENRQRLATKVSAAPGWLRQVHGCDVAQLAADVGTPTADAAVTRTPGRACAIMTADCLPVLFCDRAGSVVAAAHAGWRGLLDGVLESTLRAMAVDPGLVLAWLGPAIGPSAFEVGEEVRSAFLARDTSAAAAFVGNSRGRWHADIYALARRRLAGAGVVSVWGGGRCTVSEPEHFFSYRRDGVTGRMASLVWLRPRAGASAT